MALEVKLDTRKLDEILRTAPDKVEAFLTGFAEDMVSEIKLSFGTSPSPPGGPPGVDTGALRASMKQEKTATFTRMISDGVEYGKYLEDGTEKMAARPFMRPVFDAAQKRIESEAAQELRLE